MAAAVNSLTISKASFGSSKRVGIPDPIADTASASWYPRGSGHAGEGVQDTPVWQDDVSAEAEEKDEETEGLGSVFDEEI